MQVAKICKKLIPRTPNKVNFIHSYIYKMNKAYMRSHEGSDTFDLSFQYFNENLKINRQFNFNRKLDENVSSLLSRISGNMEKVLYKKNKTKNKSKNEGESKESELLSKIKLLQNGIEVPGDTLCKDVFTIGGDINLRLIDQDYKVVVNTPWIKNVILPVSILANFPVYPAKFETLFAEKNVSEFTWFKSHDKDNWTVVGSGFIYTPTKSDIDSYLKIGCIPKNLTNSGPYTETESTERVQADPGQCPFEIRHNFTKNILSGKNFRVVSYNLLADLYCDSDYSRNVLFSYCPPYALHIDYRKQLIIKELMGYNADIICLQEVDDKIFNNDLYSVLSTLDFDGVFCKKGNTLREGLACFYNKKRFKCINNIYKILGEDLDETPILAKVWSKISSNEKLVTRLTERGTALQITVLESLENDEILCIANTHLYFHPDADHIRLLQAGISSLYIEQMMQKLTEEHSNKRISLIFCGDFNSVPECGIYKLLTTGYVPEDFVDWNSNAEETVKGVSLKQTRLLDSACGTPRYTNFTDSFKDCLDYIFYEKDNLKVSQVIPLISFEELSAHVAIPSVVVPSDHIALVADLTWS